MTNTAEDKNLDETKRIMERLVKTPPKPHEKSGDKKSPPEATSKNDG